MEEKVEVKASLVGKTPWKGSESGQGSKKKVLRLEMGGEGKGDCRKRD